MLYGDYAAQPLLGFLTRREGVLAGASFKLTENWIALGSARYDIANDQFDQSRLGIGYVDDCFMLSRELAYRLHLYRDRQFNTGQRQHVHAAIQFAHARARRFGAGRRFVLNFAVSLWVDAARFWGGSASRQGPAAEGARQ